MDQIFNPFDRVNPFDHTNILRFQTLILQIKDKKKLIEIGRLLESRLRELK
jgi:hypothetical protein